MIDFKEVSYSTKDGRDPDEFEKFCSEFLNVLGYEVIEVPARGPDGGIDIKVRDIKRDKNEGVISEIYWLVSCKHYATSGNAVGTSHEINIRDRLESNNCVGFMCLYTTIISAPLLNQLKSQNIPHAIFDNRRIESEIIGIYDREDLFMRYFPESYKKWKELYYYTEPIELFTEYLKSETKDIDDADMYSILENWFGSIALAVKKIRNYESLKSALTSINRCYVISKSLEAKSWKNFTGKDIIDFTEANKNKIPKNKTYKINTMGSVWGFVIPCMIFEEMGFKGIIEEPLIYSNSIGLENYLVTPNYIFVSSELYNYCEKKFDKYKKLLR